MCVCVCVCVDQTVSSPHPKRTHHTLSSPCTPHLLLLPPSLLLHSPARPPCLCVCVCVCARREADCVPEKPCDGCLVCENNNKKSGFFCAGGWDLEYIRVIHFNGGKLGGPAGAKWRGGTGPDARESLTYPKPGNRTGGGRKCRKLDFPPSATLSSSLLSLAIPASPL